MGKVTLDITVTYEHDGKTDTAVSKQEISGKDGETLFGQGGGDGAITIARRKVDVAVGKKEEDTTQIDPLPKGGGTVKSVHILMTKVCRKGVLTIDETVNASAKGRMEGDCIIVETEDITKNKAGQTIKKVKNKITQCCSDLEKKDEKVGLLEDEFRDFRDEVRSALADLRVEREMKEGSEC